VAVLVLCDHANSEIPWEMVELADNRYLGAEVNLVRWVPVRLFAKDCKLDLEQATQSGEVLAFRNGPPVQHLDSDEQVLRSQLGCVPDTDWRDISRRIVDSLGRTALVYFYCHGTHDFREVERWYLEPENRAPDAFPITEFNEIPEQLGRRPVFFVNA